MSPARNTAKRPSDWSVWSQEVERLERELAALRDREARARREVEEFRERFRRLLEASRRFAHTLSGGRRQRKNVGRYLRTEHAVDRALAEAYSLETVATDILRTLGENLGWQVALLWVEGEEETLRCLAVWHRSGAVPDGFEQASLRTNLALGERLPGRAVAINRPVWEVSSEPGGPADGPSGALAFPITQSRGVFGAVELLGGEIENPSDELLHAVRIIGDRLGHFVERHRAQEKIREAEARLRLATEAGQLSLLDWNVATSESRCSGALARIFGLPLKGATLTYEDLLARVHSDDRERVKGTFDASIADGTPYDLEFRIAAPDSVRWIHLKGRVHTNEAGESTRVLGIMLDITEKRRAEQESERLRFLEASVHAEAAERERISRELHDRVAHSMGAAHQSLQLYEALAKEDPVRAHSKLETATEMTRIALEQTRNLSMEFRRSETENGIITALRDLLKVSVPDEISADLSASGAESLLPDHQRGQLYVILREAVRNAVRHSGCRHLTVGVDITPEEVSGYVKDDGRGFEGNGEGGLGLRSIKERAALLDGTARVYTSPQGSAGVRVLLPLRNGGG